MKIEKLATALLFGMMALTVGFLFGSWRQNRHSAGVTAVAQSGKASSTEAPERLVKKETQSSADTFRRFTFGNFYLGESEKSVEDKMGFRKMLTSHQWDETFKVYMLRGVDPGYYCYKGPVISDLPGPPVDILYQCLEVLDYGGKFKSARMTEVTVGFGVVYEIGVEYIGFDPTSQLVLHEEWEMDKGYDTLQVDPKNYRASFGQVSQMTCESGCEVRRKKIGDVRLMGLYMNDLMMSGKLTDDQMNVKVMAAANEQIKRLGNRQPANAGE